MPRSIQEEGARKATSSGCSPDCPAQSDRSLEFYLMGSHEHRSNGPSPDDFHPKSVRHTKSRARSSKESFSPCNTCSPCPTIHDSPSRNHPPQVSSAPKIGRHKVDGSSENIHLPRKVKRSSRTPAKRPLATAPLATAPLETELQETVPQETVPQETVPQETVPQETVPQETVPQETVPQETVPQETVPQETAPQETVPQATVPLKTVPQETAPQATAPQAMAPLATAPQETAQQETAPQATAPQATAPQATALQATAPQATAPQAMAPLATAHQYDMLPHTQMLPLQNVDHSQIERPAEMATRPQMFEPIQMSFIPPRPPVMSVPTQIPGMLPPQNSGPFLVSAPPPLIPQMQIATPSQTQRTPVIPMNSQMNGTFQTPTFSQICRPPQIATPPQIAGPFQNAYDSRPPTGYNFHQPEMVNFPHSNGQFQSVPPSQTPMSVLPGIVHLPNGNTISLDNSFPPGVPSPPAGPPSGPPRLLYSSFRPPVGAQIIEAPSWSRPHMPPHLVSPVNPDYGFSATPISTYGPAELAETSAHRLTPYPSRLPQSAPAYTLPANAIGFHAPAEFAQPSHLLVSPSHLPQASQSAPLPLEQYAQPGTPFYASCGRCPRGLLGNLTSAPTLPSNKGFASRSLDQLGLSSQGVPSFMPLTAVAPARRERSRPIRSNDVS